MSDVLDFRGVSVLRDGATLLDRVDWQVSEGERWVVLGANGAGKTTLLQLASGNLHPSRGRASILGETLGAVDVFELRPRIGLSSAALADRLPGKETVRDVVLTASYAVVGRWRERYDALDSERADELLEALGVAGLAQRRFGTLSEGERKRVQIARALMTDPELMLLDEPAAGLDLGGREDLVQRLGTLRPTSMRRPWCWSRTTWRRSRRDSPTCCCSRAAASSPRVRCTRTLTAAALGETFDIPLELERHGPRWTARATVRRVSRTRRAPCRLGCGQRAEEMG